MTMFPSPTTPKRVRVPSAESYNNDTAATMMDCEDSCSCGENAMTTPTHSPTFLDDTPALDRVTGDSLLVIPSHISAFPQAAAASSLPALTTSLLKTSNHPTNSGRNPWNSPDSLERQNGSHHRTTMMVPPPPPPPPRRIRIASIENFHPTPMLGSQNCFSECDYHDDASNQKRFMMDCKENDLDEYPRLYKKPKLAMKRGNYYTLAHDKSLNIQHQPALFAATSLIS